MTSKIRRIMVRVGVLSTIAFIVIPAVDVAQACGPRGY